MRKIQRPIITDGYYFITSVTFQRKPWFDNPLFAQAVVDQWNHYARVYRFRLDAYAILPDHYHAVLQAGRDKTISQILHAVHSFSATQINKLLGNSTKVRIWQGASRDEVIRNDEMYWQKVAYTLFNPWRANLVDDPMLDYPFSNIGSWVEREGKEFVLDLYSQNKRWGE